MVVPAGKLEFLFLCLLIGLVEVQASVDPWASLVHHDETQRTAIAVLWTLSRALLLLVIMVEILLTLLSVVGGAITHGNPHFLLEFTADRWERRSRFA